ncbi:MAG: restriction endonuclease subunit R [Flavobacterium sp.]|nr:MAG: restriction endonuclease subunit R [Flavobacterium sp.]
MSQTKLETIAENLSAEISNAVKAKRMKVKTLLKHFNYEKRSEESATRITDLLAERGVVIQPSIMKMGDEWKLKLDDQVYLLANKELSIDDLMDAKVISLDNNRNQWFAKLPGRNFRNEKEVESKFLIPLLNYLGYTEDDRFDGMPVSGAEGSKKTKLFIDFALFNNSDEALNEQVLLIAEAKCHMLLDKTNDLSTAMKQATSYALHSSCSFGIITDAKLIKVMRFSFKKEHREPIFECSIDDLQEKFDTLYNLISKDNLSRYYKRLQQ